jgi:hypothetical protein
VSFFDEADEPRAAPRTEPRRRRPSGSGRRPPTNQQSIQARRAVLVVILLIVVVLIALGVHSCQVSARNSALRSYTNNVSSLITESTSTGHAFFNVLSGSASSASPTSVQTSVDRSLQEATDQLNKAKSLSVPDQVKKAQQNVVMALQMRVDALTNIAKQIQPALGKSASKDAVYSIAAEMARLYASDVLYKSYATGQIANALHSAGIAVGGANGEPIAAGQFVPDVNWVTPNFIATELNVSLPASSSGGTGKIAPGLHGHELNSVDVGSTTLQTGSPNTIPASPAPTFTLNFTNSGTNNESNVKCQVTVSGTSDSGQTVVAQTIAGQSATCKVTLKSIPATGTATVVATIEKVPGEKNINNNTLSFPVTFQ